MNTLSQLSKQRRGSERQSLIELCGVSKVYDKRSQPVAALSNVSLTINQSEFVAVMGASGSGKSTLMNIIGCLDRPTAGQYFLDGQDVTSYSEYELAKLRNRELGFVFQSFNLLPGMTALDNVMLPLVYAGVGEDERQRRAQNTLSLLGLSERVQYRPHELSGGQQQRVSLARALINSPKVLLADEPTGQLDSTTSQEIMQILERLNSEGMTIVMVTHEQDIAAYARRLLRLKDGSIVSDSASVGRSDSSAHP